jgi:hypothetical protein
MVGGPGVAYTAAMAPLRLIADIHLDLAYNAIDFNRDLRWLASICRDSWGQCAGPAHAGSLAYHLPRRPGWKERWFRVSKSVYGGLPTFKEGRSAGFRGLGFFEETHCGKQAAQRRTFALDRVPPAPPCAGTDSRICED